VFACYHPFGEYERRVGGREYRGWRTKSHTYVETLKGPWLLYDNARDPWQMANLATDPAARPLRESLAAELRQALREIGDEFLPGPSYLERWGYPVDEHGTVPYTD
jgi:arylsulfatase A-like enzyme